MFKSFKEKIANFFSRTFQNRSTRQIIGFLVIAVIVASVLLTGIASGIAKVFQTDNEKKNSAKAANELAATGVIDTKEVSINSKLPGRILKVYVEEGKEVKAGDIIAEISSDEIQAKKDQTVKQAEAAKAVADKAQNGARPQEVAQAEINRDVYSKSLNRIEQMRATKMQQAQENVDLAQAGLDAAKAQQDAAQSQVEKADNGARAQEIAQAQAAYDLYVKTYERAKNLCDKGAIPAQKLDEIKTQLDVASQTLSMAKEGARVEDKSGARALLAQAIAGVQAAQSRYDQAVAALQEVKDTFDQKRDEVQAQYDAACQTVSMAQQGARPEDKEAAQAQYEQALAGIDEADAYLKDATIVAPMDGVITSITAHEGELVSTGMSIAQISDLSSASVEVKVKETDLQKVSAGQPVDVKVAAYADKVFTGKVVTVNQKPDFATKRSTNDNGDFDILSFGVKIELDNKDKVLHPGMTAFVQFKK